MFASGWSVPSRGLVLKGHWRGDETPARLAVAVGRGLGGAVVRNRLRRRVREAVERTGVSVPLGLDAVLVVRRGAREAAPEALEQEIEQLLGRIQETKAS